MRVFEVSYEVCNKVGGIHTVIKSKARYLVEKYGHNYYLIGPAVNKEEMSAEFEMIKDNPFQKEFKELEKEGIICYYGRWKIDGNPLTILIDYNKLWEKKNEIKYMFWDKWKIDSLRAGSDFEDPLLFSYASAKLLEKIATKKDVLHFHEWLTGGALLILGEKGYKTIFTTHATMLGRVMANYVDNFNILIKNYRERNETLSNKFAYDYGIEAKHLMEKTAVNHATVFTTVSDVTKEECMAIHGREADILLYNGLNVERFPSIEELAYHHKQNKEKIFEFLRAMLYPYYDLEITRKDRVIFIAGRYEFKNKGIDLFIDALGRVNKELKQQNYKGNVFAFFFIPTAIRGEKRKIVENVLLYHFLKTHIKKKIDISLPKVINAMFFGKDIKPEQYDDEEIRNIISKIKNNKYETLPLTAFELKYPEDKDLIIQAFKKNELLNRKEDRVKVIFYPAYLSPSDRLLNMSYYDVVRGASIGIFPSLYEPWGYTPVEAIANGTIAITSSTTGFAKYLLNKKSSFNGIYIIEREKKTYKESVEELAKILKKLVLMSKREIAQEKYLGKELSYEFGWSNFIKYYFKAHELALRR